METGNNLLKQKRTLSIKITEKLYQRLQSEVGKGKISKFLEEVAKERLERREKELELAYQEIARDKKRGKLTKEWEKAALSDLRKKTK